MENMENIISAEKIVNDYGKSLSQWPDGDMAIPISLLRNSKAEIKNAFRDYILALKFHNKLSDEMFSELKIAYGYIDLFVEDRNVKIINKVHKQLEKNEEVNKLEKEVYQEFISIYGSIAERMNELKSLVE